MQPPTSPPPPRLQPLTRTAQLVRAHTHTLPRAAARTRLGPWRHRFDKAAIQAKLRAPQVECATLYDAQCALGDANKCFQAKVARAE